MQSSNKFKKWKKIVLHPNARCQWKISITGNPKNSLFLTFIEFNLHISTNRIKKTSLYICFPSVSLCCRFVAKNVEASGVVTSYHTIGKFDKILTWVYFHGTDIIIKIYSEISYFINIPVVKGVLTSFTDIYCARWHFCKLIYILVGCVVPIYPSHQWKC